jgi:hypothetical protein
MGRQNVPLNLRFEAEQTEDLSHPGAGDALAAGDGGLVANLASVELATPLDRLPKSLDDARWADQFGRPRRACPATGRGNRDDDLAGRHPAGQGSQAALREGWVRPQSDLDGLFAVRGRRRAVGGQKTLVEGDVDDPKDDLRLGPAGATKTALGACGGASNTVTFGGGRCSSIRAGDAQHHTALLVANVSLALLLLGRFTEGGAGIRNRQSDARAAWLASAS